MHWSSSPRGGKHFSWLSWRHSTSVGTSVLWLGATRCRNWLCQCCHYKLCPCNCSLRSSQNKASQKSQVWSPSICVPFILQNHLPHANKADRRAMLAFAWDDISHMLTQASTVTQKIQKRSVRGSSCMQSLLIGCRMADSWEQRKGQNSFISVACIISMTSWELVSSQGNIDLNTALQWLWRCQMLASNVSSSSNQNTIFSSTLLQTKCSVWVLKLPPTWTHVALPAGPFWFRQQKKMDIIKCFPPHAIAEMKERRDNVSV